MTAGSRSGAGMPLSDGGGERKNHEPGVGIFPAGRLGPSGPGPFPAGNAGLCPGICGHCAGAASG